MTEIVISHLEWASSHAATWGFVLIFVFMAIESSFIPFPSEVVMIPAGFLAVRGELSFGEPFLDLSVAVICGLAGSILGAYVNYYLALWLGRPFLHKYGSYFFLPEKALNRAEEIFNKYGDITTFVCRLLPGIRQLISIPAGLSKMPHKNFLTYTILGAGIWTAILAGIGYYLGTLSASMSYADLVHKGKDLLNHNYHWIIIGLLICIAVYVFVHKKIMK